MFADERLLTWALLLLVIGLTVNSVRRMIRARSGRPSEEVGSSKDWDEWFEGFVGYLEIDNHGIVRRVNRKECELRGLPAHEVTGKHCAELEPLSVRERYRQELGRKLTEQATLIPYERNLLRPDGTIVTVRVHETLLRNKRGHTIGMRSAILDITDHRRTKEQALETASELKALFQAFPDLFLRFDTEGNVVDCKRGDPKDPFLGPEISLGRRLQDILPADAARLLIGAAARVRRTNSLEVVEYTVEGRQNQQFYECRVLPLFWDQTVAIVRNVTDRKVAEQRLEQYAQELEQKNEELRSALKVAQEATKVKSRFLANMSHEIRTPMNGVLGMTDFLLGTELTAEQREYAEAVRQSADSLLRVINDILDISKIEAGKLSLERVPFHLGVTVGEIASLFAITARAKGLEFRSAIPNSFPWMTVGDPGRLRQVLNNLLGNAVKFTDKGEVKLGMELLREATDSFTVRFSISDTGVGISREQQKQLFQSFTQLDGSSTRRYEGTGLGLAISKQLVELLGGDIGVESESGRGSTFWFTAVFEKQLAAQPMDTEPDNISLKDVRVLIAASNSISSSLKQFLEAWGCQSLEVSSGDTVIPAIRGAVAEGKPFRLALVDIDLADLRGSVVSATIKSDPMLNNLRLIAMTSAPLRGDGINLREEGFVGYVNKPVQPSTLYDTLAEVLKAPRVGSTASLPLVTRHSLSEQKFLKPRRKSRVLLAEDNPVNQRIAIRLLEKLGVQADVVVNGSAAVEALSKRDYDLVLMDCQMPEMDGFEATAIIRNKEQNERRTPICALTANAMEGDRERCLAAGMDDYIGKPFGLDELKARVDHWLQE
jgi:two-component system, sensor histidine kinase and response regulator